MKKILTLFILLTLVVSVFAGCQMFGNKDNNNDDSKPPVNENPPADDDTNADLTAAKDYVYTQYKVLSYTAGDFDVTSIVTIAGVRYTVTWTTNSEDAVIAESDKENHVKIDIIPAEPEADIPYVLTATVSDANGNSLNVSFNLTIPKFAVTTYAQYLEASADEPLVVEGVVSAIMSKDLNDTENSVFVQDLNSVGGYYVYGLADAPTVQIGQTVRVRGVKAIYNGTPEIKDATIEVVNEAIATVTPYDITEVFTAASSATDENLVNKLGAYVVIRGVTVLTVSPENSSYYLFELDGLQTYLRISGSSNCATPADLDTIKANHANHFYYTADVAGIASIYGNKFYVIPVDVNAFSNFSEEQQPLPDDVKVKMALDALQLETTFVSNNAYTLPTSTFSDVTLTWALSSTDNATIADGKLTPAIPAAGSDPVTVTLTATLNKGDVTLTKDFAITIKNLAAISITEAVTTGTTAGSSYTADKFIVTGVVKSIASTKYGNMYIKDADGNELYVYGVYDAYGVARYDALNYMPKEGDTVTLYGVLGTYGSTVQMKNAWLLAYEQGTTGGNTGDNEGGNEGGETTTPTDEEIVDQAYALEKGATLGTKTLTGVVVKIVDAYSSQHDNITVLMMVGSKSDKLITCYRMKGNVNVGDVITVTGTIKNYNGTIEFDTGATFTAAENTVTDLQKAVIEQQALNIETSFNANTTVDLATAGATYTNVAITWTVDGTAATQLNIVQDSNAKAIVVIATLACGEATVTKEFNVTVTAAATAGQKTATFTPNVSAHEDMSTHTVDDVTFVGEVGTYQNGTTPKLRTEGHIRFYGGNNIKITVAEGYIISSVKINTDGTYNIDACTFSAGTRTEGTNIVAGINADTFTITNGGSSQTRISSIEVTYVPAS